MGKFLQRKLCSHDGGLTLGRGTGLEELVGMSLRGLVAKFSYKSMECKDIEECVSSFWAPTLPFLFSRKAGMVLYLEHKLMPLMCWSIPS